MSWARFEHPARRHPEVASKAAPGDDVAPIDPDRPAIRKQVRLAQAALAKALQKAGAEIAKEAAKLAKPQATKADGADDAAAEDEAARVAAEVDLAPMRYVVAVMQQRYVDAARAGAVAALEQIGVKSVPADMQVVLGDNTMAWAEARAAELVGMRRLADGTLVRNPSAWWAIDGETRDGVRLAVLDALRSGASADELARSVLECSAFGKKRAETIARTEMALADSAGAMIAYRASGVVQGKYWSTSRDNRVSDDCILRSEQGVIDLGAKFVPGNIDTTPGHPNCRCAVLPRLKK